MNISQDNKILSDVLREISWTYILPPICFTTSLTQFINILIFSTKTLRKDPLNKYLMLHSIVNFLYVLLCSFSFLIRCSNKNICSTLSAKIYEFYYFNYLTSVLGIYAILIEIFLSLERYFIIINFDVKKKIKINPFLLILSLSSFCFVFYLPSLFIDKIEPIKNSSFYQISKSYFGKEKTGVIVSICLTSIRNFLILAIDVFINFVVLITFRRYITSKLKLKRQNSQGDNNEDKINKNMTKMIILLSSSYIIGSIPYTLVLILTNFSNYNQSLAFVKHSKGKDLKRPQVWTFGLVERRDGKANGKVYLEVVPNREAQTLLAIIYEKVLSGTTIMSDCWSSYDKIINGACTNRIESLWNSSKHRFKDMRVTKRSEIQSYLDEFIWRLITILSEFENMYDQANKEDARVNFDNSDESDEDIVVGQLRV
ncbi:unnamed protein product [Brachionus calyciflorus]|uniref:G-protein coupled receptors family 1 profile domain-containing protein n=1 Tax=Brachionus calyciflorus TaxID=104777 RepID=A0A813MTS6_9BILA|nr:unnamed protein product [Brachionus calyciflorus]